MTTEASRPEATSLPILLSPKDLAAYLGIPLATVYRWRSIGEGPPGFRVGKHVRFRVADVEAWMRASGPAKESAG